MHKDVTFVTYYLLKNPDLYLPKNFIMKTYFFSRFGTGLLLPLLSVSYTSCNQNEQQETLALLNNQTFSTSENEALLYMLEEEKLARDTYTYLGNLWSVNQFKNIKQSEQSHMDAVQNLLEFYEIPYEILPMGQFQNTELQGLYNQLTAQGETSLAKAFTVGATIEDLDIVDLENYLVELDKANIIQVFQRLQCGSRNHLRAFVFGLESMGSDYTPSYLSIEDYNIILEGNHERCGMMY